MREAQGLFLQDPALLLRTLNLRRGDGEAPIASLEGSRLRQERSRLGAQGAVGLAMHHVVVIQSVVVDPRALLMHRAWSAVDGHMPVFVHWACAIWRGNAVAYSRVSPQLRTGQNRSIGLTFGASLPARSPDGRWPLYAALAWRRGDPHQ